MNRFREFFYNRKDGRGIWKWDHYFDIYERHFGKFKNRKVNVLEIGIYSGGSLEMWRDYFGNECHVYGIDIQEECKVYENDYTSIFIGDQSSSKFWGEFKSKTPKMDIVIDDGSHKPKHQKLTFDELWFHLNPSEGVYLCEDVHGYPTSEFSNMMHELAGTLNDHRGFEKNKDNNDRRLVKKPTLNQAMIGSFHFYPYVVVVERIPLRADFIAPKRGTEWAPFVP